MSLVQISSFEALLTSLSVQVMLSSISASAKGVPNHSVYSGSKGAVEAFARCLAVGEPFPLFPQPHMCIVAKVSTDFGRKGITVNAIAPGGIKTDMYIDVARKYIPNEASMTDKQIDEVCHFLHVFANASKYRTHMWI